MRAALKLEKNKVTPIKVSPNYLLVSYMTSSYGNCYAILTQNGFLIVKLLINIGIVSIKAKISFIITLYLFPAYIFTGNSRLATLSQKGATSFLSLCATLSRIEQLPSLLYVTQLYYALHHC